MTAEQLQKAVRAKLLIRMRRGWYTARPREQRSEIFLQRTEVALVEHPESYAAYQSALVVMGLPVRAQCLKVVDLMGKGISTRRGDVQFHLPRRGIGVDEETRCVLPAFACAQASLRDPASGLMAADAALRTGMISDQREFEAALDALHGHRGVVRARLALSLADKRHESPGESETRWVAHELGLELIPQVELKGASGRTYRVDFVVKGRRVIVEYDGEEKYADVSDLVKEKKREDDLRKMGWKVVRVTKDSLRNPAALFAELFS